MWSDFGAPKRIHPLEELAVDGEAEERVAVVLADDDDEDEELEEKLETKVGEEES